ncbi:MULTISPECIES: hypothetical protein, partial [unclassified Endozoicomonas]|uniref:hypothetical protein n=1 Tax=unclassified Endozoicomonas TaxID=2644528 RepID=UPI002147FFE1
CRHRVPVFIAFCRYFGIPCRKISSLIHGFAEYSVDEGQTWKSVDLGGAPVERTKILSDFQPNKKVSSFSTASEKIHDLMKGVGLAQQQTLAEACGISFEKLDKAHVTKSALTKTNLSALEIVKNLWEKKDLTSFSMGVSVLVSQETKSLGFYERKLIGEMAFDNLSQYSPMSEAVSAILPDNDGCKIAELLKSLHSKMVVQAGACSKEWSNSIVDILSNSDLANPSVIHFAREALLSGWLDPLPNDKSDIKKVHLYHELLVLLEGVDELKVIAAHSLKKWYRELLSREKNSQVWRLDYKSFREKEGNAFFITHCHDGFSRSLEEKITHSSLRAAWTDVPEGIPNVERMLLHHPAFQQLNSGKANHRPVIILEYKFDRPVLDEKVEALIQRKAEKSPELKLILEKLNQLQVAEARYQHEMKALESLSASDVDDMDYIERVRLSKDQRCKAQNEEYQKKKTDIELRYDLILEPLWLSSEEKELLDDLKHKCRQAIEQALSHYLYGVTHSKGGSLTYCWVRAFFTSNGCDSYGAHDPSSPEELYAMMSNIHSTSFSLSIKDTYLKHVLNASNAVVLRGDELKIITGEFFSTMNLNSICDSLDVSLKSAHDE